MNNDLYIKSLALDLKRIVQGQINGSERMTDRFIQEALKWKNKIDYSTLSPSLKNILHKTDQVLKEKNKARLSDDALMYSILLLQLTK